MTKTLTYSAPGTLDDKPVDYEEAHCLLLEFKKIRSRYTGNFNVGFVVDTKNRRWTKKGAHAFFSGINVISCLKGIRLSAESLLYLFPNTGILEVSHSGLDVRLNRADVEGKTGSDGNGDEDKKTTHDSGHVEQKEGGESPKTAVVLDGREYCVDSDLEDDFEESQQV